MAVEGAGEHELLALASLSPYALIFGAPLTPKERIFLKRWSPTCARESVSLGT
jgi:hypothetical protein